MSGANSPAMAALKAEWAAFKSGGVNLSAGTGTARQQREAEKFLTRLSRKEEETKAFYAGVRSVAIHLMDVKRCVWSTVPQDFGWKIEADDLNWTISYWPRERPDRVKRIADPAFDIALALLRDVDWEIQRRLALAGGVGKKRRVL